MQEKLNIILFNFMMGFNEDRRHTGRSSRETLGTHMNITVFLINQ
jgi:hypothetical protein